ncbi:MAG: hypothetical protein PHU25_02140 [Deltaproteobacteria bacterium]|nr:hypothetical protein [Deltaproteobacteria bacterium]
MARFLAMLICLAAGGAVGWIVWKNMGEVFGSWIPLAGGGVAGFVVFLLVYFPLMRHIADFIEDKIVTLRYRMRSTKSGVDLDFIPPPPPCRICGAPGGPICRKCQTAGNR